MSDNLIIHPAVLALEEEISRYSTQISTLLEERDHQLYHVGPSLKMAYLEKVGHIEYKLFEIECKVARAKRACEMVQAAINREQPVDLTEIERKLDVEQAEYMKRLEQMSADLERMEAWRSADVLTLAQVAEIKKKYRQLVKWLHPDVNPDLTEEQQTIWRRVMIAYEENNLDMLIVLFEMVLADREQNGGLTSSNTSSEQKSSILDSLRTRRDSLHAYAKKMITDLDTLKNRHPFTLLAFLEDDEQVEKRHAELQAAIKQNEQALTEWTQFLQMTQASRGPYLN
jgi:hypothetical protein